LQTSKAPGNTVSFSQGLQMNSNLQDLEQVIAGPMSRVNTASDTSVRSLPHVIGLDRHTYPKWLDSDHQVDIGTTSKL
jgi:hypothetical protein